MTTLVLNTWKTAREVTERSRFPWRLGLLAVVVALVLSDTAAGEASRRALSDAYLAVTAFVAGTLFLLTALEKGAGVDFGRIMAENRRWQVPIAALLGAFPGCGGAIVVTTQYTAGRAGLGALVATLTATMGDAAFLLLARAPETAMLVIGLGLGSGIVAGYVVDIFHSRDATPPKAVREVSGRADRAKRTGADVIRRWPAWVPRLWVGLLIPGGVLAVLLAFQVDTDALIGLPGSGVTEAYGVIGSLLVLALWAVRPMVDDRDVSAMQGEHGRRRNAVRQVMDETNFVSAWVIGGFLAYELGMVATGADLATWFAVYAPLMPLMGVVVGLLPGCGPQIVVTTLYLNGLVPLSAQIGNALSNDGDALFPAIALAPRAATLATIYSAIPAVICAYVTYAVAA